MAEGIVLVPVAPSAATPMRSIAGAVRRDGESPDGGAGDSAAEWAGVINRALGDNAPGAGLALAGEERSMPIGSISELPPPVAGGAPDLDALAQEVYARIRRRLVIERERTWT